MVVKVKEPQVAERRQANPPITSSMCSGDIHMSATEHMTIGASALRRDLATLDEPLHSHDSLPDQEVSFMATGLKNVKLAVNLTLENIDPQLAR